MRVYVVIEESCVDDMQDLDVKVYGKKEDAVRMYEKIEDAWMKGCKNWEVSRNGYHLEMWKDGEYCNNHVNLDLEEKEVA